MKSMLIVCGTMAVLLAGVGIRPSGAKGQATAPLVSTPGAPTLEELRNATYQGIAAAGGPITLAGGQWKGAPAVEGGASAPSVTLVAHFRLTGDLDGNGNEEAVVLLAASTGGSGENIYLAAVGRREGGPRNLATAALGDRVQVRDARIDARRIIVDVVQAGPGDAMCCPGELATRSWTLGAGKLNEGAPKRTGRLSPGAMGGAEWVLREWDPGAAAPMAPEVTLGFADGSLAGGAGCNRYAAQVKAGAIPGELAVGPVSSTRMMCPDSAMAIETRFLQRLAGVDRLRFAAGWLGLGYVKDGGRGMMLFERRAKR